VALWWTALHKQCILTPLNKVQRIAAFCSFRPSLNRALNAILNLLILDLADMERAESAATRLRDTGQWKVQIYGHVEILKHDKSIPKKPNLCKSLEYNHTRFEALILDRKEWEQGRPGSTDAICFYTDGCKLEGYVGGVVYSEQLNIRTKRRSTL